jgi:hypothetical protein
MPRIFPMLAALALGLQLGAQGTPAPAARPGASVATPAQSENPAISTEDLLATNATPYHPTLVRDPFATPTDAEQTNKGDLVDDIAVKGRVVSNGRTLAVVSDARGNIRTLPVGFKFRDGVLWAIDEKTVTFHQWDPSGTNTRIFRTIVKIYKREEAKR